jgi:hypothetical protein
MQAVQAAGSWLNPYLLPVLLLLLVLHAQFDFQQCTIV